MQVEHDTQAETQASARKPEGEISQELLRKYILYAREHCSPKLYHIDEDKIARLFADMRRESLATGAYPITVSRLIPATAIRNTNRSRYDIWKLSSASAKPSAACVYRSTVQHRTSTAPLQLQWIVSWAARRLVARRLSRGRSPSTHWLDQVDRRRLAATARDGKLLSPVK